MAEASDPRVRCPECGKRIRWKSSYANRKAVCPRCGAKLRMPADTTGNPQAIEAKPAAEPEEDEDQPYELKMPVDEPGASSGGTGIPPELRGDVDVEGEPKCPSCNQPVSPGAVICVQCGFNLEAGKKMETQVVEAHELADEEPPEAEPPERPQTAPSTAAPKRMIQQSAPEEEGTPWGKVVAAVVMLAVAMVLLVYFFLVG